MIVPVIDVMGGVVVHAIAGRRADYQPIRSVLTDSTDPSDIFDALVTLTDPPFVYVADLDAIANPNVDLSSAVESLLALADRPLWVDAGLRSDRIPRWLTRHERAVTVVGSETIPDLAMAIDLLDRLGPERCVLSLDWMTSIWTPNGPLDDWLGEWHRHGGWNVIWLDLASVGVGGRSIEVVNWWEKYSQLSHFAAGGIRSRADVAKALIDGATGCLVASALHDGRIGRTL